MSDRARRFRCDHGAAELTAGAGLDAAAQLFDHRLLAVADPQHRWPCRQQGRIGAAYSASVTDAGPPDRITARGAKRVRNAASTLVHGWILQQTPDSRTRLGDQLRHLAAEIDDEDAVGHQH